MVHFRVSIGENVWIQIWLIIANKPKNVTSKLAFSFKKFIIEVETEEAMICAVYRGFAGACWGALPAMLWATVWNSWTRSKSKSDTGIVVFWVLT